MPQDEPMQSPNLDPRLEAYADSLAHDPRVQEQERQLAKALESGEIPEDWVVIRTPDELRRALGLPEGGVVTTDKGDG